jgi:hypothetical protein
MGKVTSTADIKLLLDRQRNFFDSGRTKDIAFRPFTQSWVKMKKRYWMLSGMTCPNPPTKGI